MNEETFDKVLMAAQRLIDAAIEQRWPERGYRAMIGVTVSSSEAGVRDGPTAIYTNATSEETLTMLEAFKDAILHGQHISKGVEVEKASDLTPQVKI